ncbi:MAG TPA: hypothetical protein VNN79_20955 [Actinomycetota bacterium]|nr:hypothetical protein [Actinomycetota bacterium]
MEPERAPDLTTILDAVNAGWRRHAGCAGDEDANWFPDTVSKRCERFLGSPIVLRPLLICAGCPVRVDCLREGVEAWEIRRRDDGHTDVLRSQVHAAGIWGGTLDLERQAVRHLPSEQAVRELERTFRKRLRRRVAAFRRGLPKNSRHVPKGRVARVLNMLDSGRAAVTGLPRRCAGCRTPLPALVRSDARYCSVRCRVAAYRVRAAA